jgi:apolipoprotein N-acyltransferase
MRAPEGRAEWLVQITNDAWFGSLAGPYQHLAQARARAIEQGLPLVRSANTGISAMIDPRGRVLDELALGTAGYFDASLPPPLPRTLYATFGDLPVVAFVLTIIGLTFTNLLDGLFLVRHR